MMYKLNKNFEWIVNEAEWTLSTGSPDTNAISFNWTANINIYK